MQVGKRWLGVATAGVVGVACLAPATPAAAAQPAVQCGAVLTADTTLHADLTCSGDAFIIGADGITVDLRGHTVRGSSAGSGLVIQGRKDIGVRNGTFAGFRQAALIGNTNGVTFTKVTMSEGAGLSLKYTENVQFTHGSLTSLSSINGDHTSITHSHINSGFSLVSSISLTFTDDVFTDASISLSEGAGLDFSDNRLIRSGIYFGQTDKSVIRHNRFSGAKVGVYLGDDADHVSVIDNTFEGNQVGTIVSSRFLDASAGTTLTGNTYRHNGAAGILYETNGGSCFTCPEVSGNTFVGNGFDPAGLTDHLGNPVADGLHFAVPARSQVNVADNVTRHNAAYGIYAASGTVLDGGGNTSRGNPSGCLGVLCTH